jgi:hypothetical protein
MEFHSARRKSDKWFQNKWMQLEDIIVSDISQAQKDKGHHVFSRMWNTDPTQMQQYYETQVTLRGGDTREREVKEGS